MLYPIRSKCFVAKYKSYFDNFGLLYIEVDPFGHHHNDKKCHYFQVSHFPNARDITATLMENSNTHSCSAQLSATSLFHSYFCQI